MGCMGYLQLCTVAEYFNRLVYSSKSGSSWPVHRTITLDLITLGLYLTLLTQFLTARGSTEDGFTTSYRQNVLFNLPTHFKYVAIALIVFVAVKLSTYLASTRVFGRLMYLIRHLFDRCVTFAFIVLFELFVFVVVCMLLNTDKENSVELNFAILMEGTVYGNY